MHRRDFFVFVVSPLALRFLSAFPPQNEREHQEYSGTWYLRYSLSYRDLKEMMVERGLLVDHVTIWRWVQMALGPALRAHFESAASA